MRLQRRLTEGRIGALLHGLTRVWMTDTREANADGKLGNLVPLSHKRVCPHHGACSFPGPKHLTA